MSIRSKFLGVVFPLLAVLPLSAQAQSTDSTTFRVLIEIMESCNISDITASDVDFGAHPRGIDSNVDAQGTLNVLCSIGTDYNIGLDAGLNPTSATASANNRRMLGGGGDLIPYGLYQDATRTAFWGNVIGTDTLPGVGTGVSAAIPVYGRAPSTDFPPGNYEDTVTATITY